MIPPSQSYRNIGFLLTGAPSGDVAFEFGLKPEELTYSEPSRLNVQQTLGGAWADSFDRGVGMITLSGTTGWRGTALQSGEEMFLGLRSTVFQGWHDARAQLIQQGSDPNSIQLFMTDSLDNFAVVVAPRSFTLHRSRTSPLLMRYNIQLLVLAEADSPIILEDPIIFALSNPQRWLTAVAGLQNLVLMIARYAAQAQAVFGAAIDAVNSFVAVGVGLINSVVNIATQTVGEFAALESSILGVGIQFAHAAANAFNVLCDDATLLTEALLPVQALAAAFQDAACSMENGFNLIGKYNAFDAVRGASGCSSTGGGDPASIFTIQDVNPFEYAIPAGPPLVLVTPEAQAAMVGLAVDPLLLRGQQDAVYQAITTISDGVTVQ